MSLSPRHQLVQTARWPASKKREVSYYSLGPSELQSLQFLFVIQLFFCGRQYLPTFFGRLCYFLGPAYFELSCLKKKQIRSPEYYRRRRQQLEKGIILYAIVATGTGEPYSH
jgi:hypothetical protein